MLTSATAGANGRFRHYLGWLNGQPVACATLLLAANSAGIYNMVTLPKARKQGVGLAMCHFALEDARNAGYTTAVLHSSPWA